MNPLYHGSLKALDVVKPFPSNLTNNIPVVFATPIWIIALIMGTGWKDNNINCGYVNGALTVTEVTKDAFERFFHRQTYVYTFDYDESLWYHHHNLWACEFVSYQEQIPIHIQTVEDPFVHIQEHAHLVYYK